MKRTWIGLLVVVFAVSLFAGCSATRIDYPTVSPPANMEVDTLNRTQYEVLEKTSGDGTTKMVALWPLPIWWMWGDDGSFWMWGYKLRANSWHIARNRAVRQVTAADDLMDPIVEDKTFFALWYARIDTSVTGKAISIKTDAKCKKTEDNCWESIKWQDKD